MNRIKKRFLKKLSAKEKFMKKIFIFCMLALLLVVTAVGKQPIAALAEGELELTCKSSCLVDYASGTVLYGHNTKAHLPIASMVKLMTISLVLDEFDEGRMTEDTMITTSENASGMGGSQVFIDPYVQYSAADLLKSVIMASANDASVALAEHVSGSESSFVVKMNEKAKKLGMNDTNYVNCTGLPAPEQYSCAHDCAIVLGEVTGHELYHKFSSVWMDELTHPSGRKTELVNTNRLVRYYQGCDSGKTGSTNEAGCCLSASAERNGMRLISVVIGANNSQTRFNECTKLFNYGFANFESKSILDSRSPVMNLPINKGKADNIDVFAERGFSTVVKKGGQHEFEVTFENPSKISAPTQNGMTVGKAIISKQGTVVDEINLIVKENVEKLSLKDCFDRITQAW